jgi:hypothetical protein
MSHSDHTDDLDLSILEQMGYEERDLKVEKTPGLGFWMTVFITAMTGVAWVVIWLIQPDLSGRPEKETSFRNMPGKDYPLIQSNATAHRDMIKLRADERKRVEGYGYVEGSRTKVHIPLDRAMDLVLEEGLPVSPTARKMKKPEPDMVMPEPSDMKEGSGGSMPVTEHENSGSQAPGNALLGTGESVVPGDTGRSEHDFPDVPADHQAFREAPGSATTGGAGAH